MTIDSSPLIAIASESDQQVQNSKLFTNREIGSVRLEHQHSEVVNNSGSRTFGLLRLFMLSFTSFKHTNVLFHMTKTHHDHIERAKRYY